MGIAEEQMPCWLITCDRCGEGDGGDEHSGYHWPSEREARQQVKDSDWIELPDGRLLCMSCWEDEIPDEVACPRCAAPVGELCRRPDVGWVPTCDERIAAWAAANPPDPPAAPVETGDGARTWVVYGDEDSHMRIEAPTAREAVEAWSRSEWHDVEDGMRVTAWDVAAAHGFVARQTDDDAFDFVPSPVDDTREGGGDAS